LEVREKWRVIRDEVSRKKMLFQSKVSQSTIVKPDFRRKISSKFLLFNDHAPLKDV